MDISRDYDQEKVSSLQSILSSSIYNTNHTLNEYPSSEQESPEKSRKRISYILSFQIESLNIKSLLPLEAFLSKLACNISLNLTCFDFIQEYGKLISETEYLKVTKRIKDFNYKQLVKRGIILEICFICVLYKHQNFEFTEFSKLISYSIHQNFLLLLEVIISKVPSIGGANNIWLKYVKSLIRSKKASVHVPIFHSMRKHTEEIADALNSQLNNIVELEGYSSLTKEITRVIKNKNRIKLKYMKSLAESVLSSYIIREPYLPAMDGRLKYTLVLDLDETLVHLSIKNANISLLQRPGCTELLKNAYDTYEIVVFTASLEHYTEWVVSEIDTQKWVSHKLNRNHTTKKRNFWVKDLSKLGRSLSRVVMVDCSLGDCSHTQPENVIGVSRWLGDPDDNALFKLTDVLINIAKQRPKDIREEIKLIKSQVSLEL